MQPKIDVVDHGTDFSMVWSIFRVSFIASYVVHFRGRLL